MTGLDKMKNQILAQAKAEAAEKISQAEDEAAKILKKVREEAEAEAAKILEKGEADVKIFNGKSESSNDLMKRTRMLSAKQEIIKRILDKVYDGIEAMDDGGYFGMLAKMVKNHARGEEGEICFSNRDLERLPQSFMEKAQAAAREKGGGLKLREKGIDIENGFILTYGGIEENCTLKAMFDSKRDELSDVINRFLFP